MKKYLLILMAAFAFTTSAMAQKVDVASINAGLAKADAAAEHPKKSLKASTWLSRGDKYFESVTKPTEMLFIGGIDITMLEASCGKGKRGSQTIDGKSYVTLQYPYFKAYCVDNKIKAWIVTKQVKPNAVNIAIESYKKAYEMDPSTAPKVKKALDGIVNYYKQLGNAAVVLSDMKRGADAFIIVNRAQNVKAYGEPEAAILFYAGYMMTIYAEKNPGSYPAAEGLLKRALDGGYQKVEDADKAVKIEDRGNLYYYMFCCAYGQREKKPAKLEDAKKYLLEGIESYPQNNNIFEGLIQIYTNEEGMGDPKELLGPIEKSIAANPKSVNAWFGRGRVYFALKNYDECIVSFKKVVELDPTMFAANFYLALFYVQKGDDMFAEMNKKSYSNQAEYDKEFAISSAVYLDSIPYFEAAHKINPQDEPTLNYLKQLCFKFRDMDGMMDKYNKYNELWKAVPQPAN